MTSEKELYIYKAKIAEQAELFDEMVEFMKRVVELNPCLSLEERILVSVAYKNKVNLKRTSWRTIQFLEEMERKKDMTSLKLIEFKNIKTLIENDVRVICFEIISIVDNFIIPHFDHESIKDEDRVFWFKLKGDYYRYMAEFEKQTKRKDSQEKSYESYQLGLDEGSKLISTSPTLLGLVLNYSVFHYEILNDKEKACAIAKKYFDLAIQGIDQLSDSEYKDTTLILQLTKDNISLWTESTEEDSE